MSGDYVRSEILVSHPVSEYLRTNLVRPTPLVRVSFSLNPRRFLSEWVSKVRTHRLGEVSRVLLCVPRTTSLPPLNRPSTPSTTDSTGTYFKDEDQ